MGELLYSEFPLQTVSLYSYSYYYSEFMSFSKSNSIGSLPVDILLWSDHVDTKFGLLIVDFIL